MQSTGQASTQAVSLVPIQGSAITYAILSLLRFGSCFSRVIVAYGGGVRLCRQGPCFAMREGGKDRDKGTGFRDQKGGRVEGQALRFKMGFGRRGGRRTPAAWGWESDRGRRTCSGRGQSFPGG